MTENAKQPDRVDNRQDSLSSTAPKTSAATYGNQTRPRRYRENPFRQLFPGWKYPATLRDQDHTYFQDYLEDIQALKDAAQNHEACGPAVLTSSQRIYDDELARRESINTRCGAVLSTGGILGALFVAAAQLGLTQEKGGLDALTGVVLAVFIIALAYIGVSITMALAIQGQVKGNVLDPSDIVNTDKSSSNRYNMELAIGLLNYTVANYGVNNDFKFKLNSAQRCLRNGIIAIIIAGMLSPWALRMAGGGSSALPSPVAYRTATPLSLTVGRTSGGPEIR